jgi:hypothetical protein
VFDRGLVFIETVTQMVPKQMLAFTIEANPASIAPRALDEQVLMDGQYFDILDGKYEIERISDHEMRLHLTSRFRLSTYFNFYSRFWSQLIMRDIQQNILRIIKDRSKKEYNQIILDELGRRSAYTAGCGLCQCVTKYVQ